jgi:hypothetical protein
MVNSSHEHGNGASHSGSLLARLRIVWDILTRLASLVNPTQQDLQEAGVYIGETHE